MEQKVYLLSSDLVNGIVNYSNKDDFKTLLVECYDCIKECNNIDDFVNPAEEEINTLITDKETYDRLNAEYGVHEA